MLRLELEAEVANPQAEVEAMAADAAVEEGGSPWAAPAAEPTAPSRPKPHPPSRSRQPRATRPRSDAEPDADEAAART